MSTFSQHFFLLASFSPFFLRKLQENLLHQKEGMNQGRERCGIQEADDLTRGKWPKEIPGQQLCCRPLECLVLTRAHRGLQEGKPLGKMKCQVIQGIGYVKNNIGRSLNLCSNVTFSMKPTLITLFSLTTHASICIPNSPYVGLFSTWHLSYFNILYILLISYVYCLSPNQNVGVTNEEISVWFVP